MNQMTTPTIRRTLLGWSKNVGTEVPGTTLKEKEEKRRRGLLLCVPLLTHIILILLPNTPNEHYLHILLSPPTVSSR
jgi:hypothetical protein